MSQYSQYFRLPTPKKFMGFFDLQYGAELTLMSLLINKCSGIFGVLAIFSGAHISGVQLSMYFYSLSLFSLLCFLTPRIRHRSPLAAISFAYIYLIDSVINIAYTVLFSVSWFLVLAARTASSSVASSAGKTMDNNAGFTSPAFNVSEVNVVASPADSVVGGQNAVAIGTPADAAATGIRAGILQPESATSILIIAIFWTIRLYFVVIAFAWAREVVRSSATSTEEPFEGHNDGEGWRGRLGRSLIGLYKPYWRGDGWKAGSRGRASGSYHQLGPIRQPVRHHKAGLGNGHYDHQV
ncbi:Inositolphosphorylceramide synthase subunit Kei1-domain-containing protein [Sphaerosporella brunnea]|uniref:Inositolphosphorylceramide synthase subunit Kei1-domain-containing protein n=1 Tax=Sphaerosporella brunnea TaxID=1250544 RepID=A0A5J5EZI9_9PEZI|nr:Inositolphosphorylceramide synthase subunit Kei1-domain-containing protein [Sphaerosporella brunnea]